LVNAKKKKKDTSFNNNNLNNNNLKVVNNNNILVSKSNNSFSAKDNKDFSSYKDDTFKGNVAISRVREDIREFDINCYKDICLLVIYNREQNVLAIKVIITYYKGHQRRLKL
jgi:hypothetical protein